MCTPWLFEIVSVVSPPVPPIVTPSGAEKLLPSCTPAESVLPPLVPERLMLSVTETRGPSCSTPMQDVLHPSPPARPLTVSAPSTTIAAESVTPTQLSCPHGYAVPVKASGDDRALSGLETRIPTKPVPVMETTPPAVSFRSNEVNPDGISKPTESWSNAALPSRYMPEPETVCVSTPTPAGNKTVP